MYLQIRALCCFTLFFRSASFNLTCMIKLSVTVFSLFLLLFLIFPAYSFSKRLPFFFSSALAWPPQKEGNVSEWADASETPGRLIWFEKCLVWIFVWNKNRKCFFFFFCLLSKGKALISSLISPFLSHLSRNLNGCIFIHIFSPSLAFLAMNLWCEYWLDSYICSIFVTFLFPVTKIRLKKERFILTHSLGI